MVIENRTGAGGNIGAHAVNVALFSKMPYDPIKDFAPIALLVDAGTASHLAGELFKSIAKVDLLHVPYKGNVPAIRESLPGFVVNNWVGFFAPAGTPADIVQRLNAEIGRAHV